MKTIIALFGITGDLSQRKLLPALEAIHDSLPQPFELVGVTRQSVIAQDVLGADSLFASQTAIVTMDLNNQDDYKRLWNEHLSDPEAQVLVFLAVPPMGIPSIVKNLGGAGFSRPNVKILLEKPFGFDEQSAVQLFREVTSVFEESQLYLLDHYLGKRAARGIIPFRRQSPALASVWNKENIDRIEVVASETIDVEGRTAFYEQTGALRDVLQGHLLQMLALTICSVDSLDEMLCARRAQLLASLLPADPAYAVRGQYEGYREEVSNPDSHMETCAEVTFYSDNPTWQGVPMILTTGKALAAKETVIRVHFRDTNHLSYGCLTFHLQPDNGIIVHFEGDGRLEDEIRAEVAQFKSEGRWDGYENIFLDALHSDKMFFVSQREVVASWNVVSRVLEAWQQNSGPLIQYAKGTSIDLIFEKYRNC